MDSTHCAMLSGFPASFSSVQAHTVEGQLWNGSFGNATVMLITCYPLQCNIISNGRLPTICILIYGIWHLIEAHTISMKCYYITLWHCHYLPFAIWRGTLLLVHWSVFYMIPRTFPHMPSNLPSTLPLRYCLWVCMHFLSSRGSISGCTASGMFIVDVDDLAQHTVHCYIDCFDVLMIRGGTDGLWRAPVPQWNSCAI